MTETLTKIIFGTKLKITFIGDDIDDKGYFHILEAGWARRQYSDFQNILFEEYIQSNLEKFEEEINNFKPEL